MGNKSFGATVLFKPHSWVKTGLVHPVAFTGRDSSSFFNGKGKKSVCLAWNEKDEKLTRAL